VPLLLVQLNPLVVKLAQKGKRLLLLTARAAATRTATLPLTSARAATARMAHSKRQAATCAVRVSASHATAVRAARSERKWLLV
jgi:hypothetical protein